MHTPCFVPARATAVPGVRIMAATGLRQLLTTAYDCIKANANGSLVQIK